MAYLITLVAGICLGIYFTRSYYLERERRRINANLRARHHTAHEIRVRELGSEGVRRVPRADDLSMRRTRRQAG